MPNLKTFVLGVVKLAVALVLALVALVLIVWAYSNYSERKEEEIRAPLANPKVWPPITLEPLGNVRLGLTTMWRDGRVYYQFRIDGCPPVFLAALVKTQGPEFTITFLDAHGFRMHEQSISLASMAQLIGGTSGTPDGFEWKGDEYLSVDAYRSAAKWEVFWSGFPKEAAENASPQSPQTPPGRPAVPHPRLERPRWRVTANWRGLSHGMSKEAVRQLLGEPDKVIAFAGRGSWWYYGYPSGGQVSFRPDGTVESWSEP